MRQKSFSWLSCQWSVPRIAALPAACLVILAVAVLPAQHAHHGPDHIMVAPEAVTWGPGPASLPPGARAAVLEGDPAKAGPFTLRLELPANYRVAPHQHPAIEHLTVLSGTLFMGLGERFQESKAGPLSAGAFAVMQPGVNHFVFTRSDKVVIQLHGIGPWGITYVNPADDPRNARP